MPAEPPTQALASRTLDLVDIHSPSRGEQRLYEYVKEHVPLPVVYDDGETLLYARRGGLPLVLLSGHTDTVPAQGNIPGRIEAGAVHGLGSTDMKGGLAVMIELARWAVDAELGYDLGLVFFPREEIGPEWNPLPALFDSTPVVDESALVICLEPTDNTLQLGCLGNINARVVFEGRAAHSARPWLGVNAIGLALEGLRCVLELPPNDVDIDGLVFREVVSVTQIDDCGNASNVIPGRVECMLNYRFAPTRTKEEAEERLRSLVGREIEIVQSAAAAHVALRSPLVEHLRQVGDFAVEPKQAWTNVADFAARGLDALNLGPGTTRYAHTADERVEIAELGKTYDALQRFLSAG
ncbi:MAG TPA: succinyl-diaminopimelate desuccinylase [Gaiellaceae bacterium]|jgi:succinyl-diaminopimelate desuccinylase|nr:succinyl-diaminopimelate desuccinylase [Gaiellaceae bacterium]